MAWTSVIVFILLALLLGWLWMRGSEHKKTQGC